MSKILYVDEKKQGLKVEYKEFRGKWYIHLSKNILDLDTEDWYRIKNLSFTSDYIDYLIEGLLEVEKQIAKQVLPDKRQLEFEFTKGRMNEEK